MTNTAYGLKVHDETNEMHLFAGKFTPHDLMHKCNASIESVCKEVKKADCKTTTFTCKNEQEARDLCAKIGRSVCANCIKELYKTL